MKSWLKWGGIIIVAGIVGFMLWKFWQCRKKGRESGEPFKCKLFCGDPDFRLLEEEYFTLKEGKCYRVFDYGDTMSIRRVAIENCGEKDLPVKSDVIEDAEYF